MERWARQYPGATFLCVCVDKLGVALQFGRVFDLQEVVNCHIPSREYLPRGYGQLGCSGFVVADGKGNFLSRKTRAYLEYGDAAFGHVEELLASQGVSREVKAAGIKSSQPKVSNKKDHERAVSSAVDRDEKKEEAPVEKVLSVGVDSMDDEHKRCEAALTLLRQTNSVKALEALMGELIQHFEHEENLMKEHKFGTTNDKNASFSPYISHCKDHERILDIGFRALAKAHGYSKGTPSAGDCDTGS